MKNNYIIAGSIFGFIFIAQTGVIAFAQGNAIKTIAEPIMGTSSTTTSAESQVFGRGIDTLKNIIPEQVQDTTGNVFVKLNDFRSRERDLVEVARVDNIEQIDVLNQKEITASAEFTWKNHIERILRYMHWMFLVLGGTILAHAWIFYFILFLVLYSILRALWHRIRSAGV